MGILVASPGIEPVLPAMVGQSLNHRTAREFPHLSVCRCVPAAVFHTRLVHQPNVYLFLNILLSLFV